MYALLQLLAILTLLCVHRGVETAVVVVGQREKLCLWDFVPPHTRATFQFYVVETGGKGIKATLHDQNGTELMQWDRASSGDHEVLAKVGATALHACFDNTGPHEASKRVSFHFRFHVDYNSVSDETKLLDPVERLVLTAAKSMRRMQLKQERLQALQYVHKETVDATEKWMMLWSIFQAISLLFVTIFQLYFLKCFLERKSFV